MWWKGPAKNREKHSIKIRKENKNLFIEKLPCLCLRLDAQACPPWCICQCSRWARHRAQEKPSIANHILISLYIHNRYCSTWRDRVDDIRSIPFAFQFAFPEYLELWVKEENLVTFFESLCLKSFIIVSVLDRQPTKGSTRSRWMWPRRDR
jgi:hypothetical protein